MIDLKHYTDKHLDDIAAKYIIRFYSKKEFKNLYHMKMFFSEMKEEDVKWMKEEKDRKAVLMTAPHFARCINDKEFTTIDEKFELIYEKLDPVTFFPELNIKVGGTGSHTCKCPNPDCAKGMAFIGGKGEGHFITCNRLNKCAYNKSFFDYYKETTSNGNMVTLAHELGINFEAHEVHVGQASSIKKFAQRVTPKAIEEKPIEYMSFDANREYKKVHNASDYIPRMHEMNDLQKYQLMYEYFFRIIKRERNKADEKRRTPMWNYLLNKRSFDIDSKLINDMGFLHLDEVAPLLGLLVKMFKSEDLYMSNLVKKIDTDKNFSFLTKEIAENAVALLSTKYDAEQLVEKGVLNSLDSDHPYKLNFKGGSLKAIEIIKNDFGKDELMKFAIAADENNNFFQFSFSFLFNEYEKKSGLIFLKSNSLYTGMAEEFRIRPTHIKKGMEKYKEVQQSNNEIIKALPFGLSHESLIKANYLFATEGPMDITAFGNNISFRNEDIEVFGFGIPGVNRVVVEQLGLLRGKTVVIFFDADKAGKEGALKFQKMLEKAGVSSIIAQWNPFFLVDNKGSLKFHKTLKNHLMVVNTSFTWLTKSFKDVNDIKKEINKENNTLPFDSLSEFMEKFVVLHGLRKDAK